MLIQDNKTMVSKFDFDVYPVYKWSYFKGDRAELRYWIDVKGRTREEKSYLNKAFLVGGKGWWEYEIEDEALLVVFVRGVSGEYHQSEERFWFYENNYDPEGFIRKALDAEITPITDWIYAEWIFEMYKGRAWEKEEIEETLNRLLILHAREINKIKQLWELHTAKKKK